MSADYLVFFDRSGSMVSRIEYAKKALISFITNLPVDSHFDVISFGSTFSSLNHFQLRVNNQKNIDNAI